MAIVFITGSTEGLGRAAAQSLLDEGHQIVLHARSADRAKAIGEIASRAAGVVIGDLRSAGEVRSIADQVNGAASAAKTRTSPPRGSRITEHGRKSVRAEPVSALHEERIDKVRHVQIAMRAF